jgi:hypothetical protein
MLRALVTSNDEMSQQHLEELHRVGLGMDT